MKKTRGALVWKEERTGETFSKRRMFGGRQRGALIATEVPAYVMNEEKRRRSGEHETGLAVACPPRLASHMHHHYHDEFDNDESGAGDG